MKIIFTKHAEERLEKRKITEDEVKNAIKYPEKLYKEQGRYYAQKNIGRGTIEVVYEIIDIDNTKYLNIITIYWL